MYHPIIKLVARFGPEQRGYFQRHTLCYMLIYKTLYQISQRFFLKSKSATKITGIYSIPQTFPPDPLIYILVFPENEKACKLNIYRLLVKFKTLFAEWTGLEPATSCVTGRHSNQLNYHSFCSSLKFEPLSSFEVANIETIS